MIRPTEVEPREGYRIWLRYSDGTAGGIDLSHLAGRGVFRDWNDRACFETVHIAPAGGIAWGEDGELCPDALYMGANRAFVSDKRVRYVNEGIARESVRKGIAREPQGFPRSPFRPAPGREMSGWATA